MSIKRVGVNEYTISEAISSEPKIYEVFCGISFSKGAIERGSLTEDDMQDICEAVELALLNALEDKENDHK